jgi:REP element-mobilizing transposase RayT
MIVGYYIIFGAYGFWLPNDPRGSWSDFVGSWDLYRYGKTTKTTDRINMAYKEHNAAERLEAKKLLKYPAVQFTGIQARAIARGIGNYAKKRELEVWSCAILPDHVHVVTAITPIGAEQLATQLKSHATKQLIKEDIHPLSRFPAKNDRPPKCFQRGEWKVFLDPDDIENAIQYVQENPIKEGKKQQHWNFVVPYEPT